MTLAEAQTRHAPEDRPLRESSWGEHKDLSTWDAPEIAELVFAARAAELQVAAAGEEASVLALRELLALQSSDWAFLITRELAASYGRERAEGHRRALEAALRIPDAPLDGIRTVARYASRAPLLLP